MPVVRFVAGPGGAPHGGGLDVFQEPGVCNGRRPFRFRPGPLFEGQQHLQGRIGLLEPWARRACLVGVFGLSADGGGSLRGRLRRSIGFHPGMARAEYQPARGEGRRVYRCRCGWVRSETSARGLRNSPL